MVEDCVGGSGEPAHDASLRAMEYLQAGARRSAQAVIEGFAGWGRTASPAWYRREEVEPGVTKLLEPHVDRVEQANMWHVRGRDRDLLIDGGMGIVPLRPAFPDLFEPRLVLAVATHTHLDHIGALHEFPERWVHAIEADGLAQPRQYSLVSDDLDLALRRMFVAVGYAPLGPYLYRRPPVRGLRPRQLPAAARAGDPPVAGR